MDWLSKALDSLVQLWERGKTLLWALAAICAIVFGILLVGKLYGVASATSALASYGLWLIIGAAAFGVLALVKTIETRRNPSVHMIPDNRQSFWAQSTQPDGRVTTQLCFRMQVTNLTKGSIRLSAVQLSRPWTRARVLENQLITRSPQYPRDNTFSRENFIPPGNTTQASAILIFDQPIGRRGKPMAAAIKVSDQFGRWHKLKFKLTDPHAAK